MSIKRITEDNYIKENKSKQDIINEDNEQIIKNLKNFIRIPNEFCEYLILGSKIKYITDDGIFRYGGILINNKFPNYIVLLNPYKKITWCVNLNTNNIFMEDVKKKNEEKNIKESLFKLYKKDLLQIKEENKKN
tara:strand:+ start:252 stop:653 length:402 start_codon:yes stop_codon:yes gene_type:complete